MFKQKFWRLAALVVVLLGTAGMPVYAEETADAPASGGVGILQAAEQAGFEGLSCPAGAANCVETGGEEVKWYSTTGTQTFVLRLLGGMLNFAAIAAVLLLVVAGTRLVLAMGNDEKLQAARKHVLWTLAGLVVIILSLLIVRNVTETIYESTVEKEKFPHYPFAAWQEVSACGAEKPNLWHLKRELDTSATPTYKKTEQEITSEEDWIKCDDQTSTISF